MYKIIQASSLPELTTMVCSELFDGRWKLQGGVCSFDVHNRNNSGDTWVELWFCQALVAQ